MSDDQGVEKGFNDDELADIMSEIESLEKDYEEESVEASSDEQPEEVVSEQEVVEEKVEEPVVEEVVEQPVEAVAEEVMEEVVSKPVEEVVPEGKVHQMPVSKGKGTAHSSMQFQVEGDMKLQMSFFVAGKEFSVWVDEEDGFVIQLDGGAQFKVPIDSKKAA
jgi:hypothetical protein